MIYIALYRGKSLMSKAIMWLNWSDYSHASLITSAGTEIEAWAGDGIRGILKGGSVREVQFGLQHTSGTHVDVFQAIGLTERLADRIEARIRTQIGRPYDWAGVFRFVSRRAPVADGDWFCSELVAWAFEQEGWALLNKPPQKIYPGEIAASPKLRKVELRITHRIERVP